MDDGIFESSSKEMTSVPVQLSLTDDWTFPWRYFRVLMMVHIDKTARCCSLA